MDKGHKIEGGQAVLSNFLSDFRPKRVPDEAIELFPAGPDVAFDAPPVVEESAPEGVLADADEFDAIAAADGVANETMEELSSGQPMKAAAPPPDLDAIRSEAAAQAAEQTRVEMQAKFDAEKAALESAHVQALEEIREQTINELAAHLDEQLKSALEQIAQSLSLEVATVLQGFISERLTKEAVDGFAKKLAQTAITAGTPLVIEGNAVLIAALKKVPGFNAMKYTYIENEDGDIRLRLGDQVIATRLEPLMAELKELVR